MMNAHLPRFVEYGRVSSAGQERRQTQEGQFVALERLRASRPGVPVLAAPVFEPKHVSAMEVPLSERSEWTRVVEPLIRSGAVDEVRVAEFNRLVREQGLDDAAHLMGLMREHPFIVVDGSGGIHAASDFGRKVALAIKCLMGGEEWRDIRDKTTNGRIKALRRGQPGSGPGPTGLKHRKGEGWSVDEKWAPAIRRIYALCIEGVPLQGISDVLNGEGVAPPRGKGWNFTFVRKVLRNPAYKGELHQRLQGVDYLLPVPPIVDEETWEAAQAALSARRWVPLRERYATEALCRTLARCGTCDRRMYVLGGGAEGGAAKHTRYYCPDCKGAPYHRADLVDLAVWQAISKALIDADSLLVAVATPEASAGEDAAESELSEVGEHLARNERKVAGLTARWKRDAITDADYDRELDALRAEREALARRENVARRAIEAADRTRHQQATLATTLAALRSRIAGADYATRRAIVEAVVPLETGSIRLNVDYSFSIHGVLPVISSAPVAGGEPEGGEPEETPIERLRPTGTEDYTESGPRPPSTDRRRCHPRRRPGRTPTPPRSPSAGRPRRPRPPGGWPGRARSASCAAGRCVGEG
jgi:DNA invertase Pin-like site-specific DNA recombinase